MTKSFQKSWDPSLPLEPVVAQEKNPRGGLYEHGEGQDWPVDSRARELWKHSREHPQERLEGRPSSQPVCPKSQSEGIGRGGNGLSHGGGGGGVCGQLSVQGDSPGRKAGLRGSLRTEISLESLIH